MRISYQYQIHACPEATEWGIRAAKTQAFATPIVLGSAFIFGKSVVGLILGIVLVVVLVKLFRFQERKCEIIFLIEKDLGRSLSYNEKRDISKRLRKKSFRKMKK